MQDQVSKDKALQTVANLSSAQIVSASVMKPQTPFPASVRVRQQAKTRDSTYEVCIETFHIFFLLPC